MSENSNAGTLDRETECKHCSHDREVVRDLLEYFSRNENSENTHLNIWVLRMIRSSDTYCPVCDPDLIESLVNFVNSEFDSYLALQEYLLEGLQGTPCNFHLSM